MRLPLWRMCLTWSRFRSMIHCWAGIMLFTHRIMQVERAMPTRNTRSDWRISLINWFRVVGMLGRKCMVNGTLGRESMVNGGFAVWLMGPIALLVRHRVHIDPG